MDGPRKLWPPLASLTPSMRLQVLYDLCSFTLFDLETLMTRPNMQDLGPRWRLEAIGNDKHGLRYWFLADRWLFSENPHRPQTKAKSTRKGPRNREEEEAADDSEEEWKCVAWDSASWHAFLDDNPFARSRKASDREILRRFREEIYPVAEPLILEEERRRRVVWKKEQAEIQRLALFESRKRSSRLAAKEKIRAELQMEELPLARLATTKAPKGREKRPLSREERVALRNQKIAKMEETILTAALEQSSRDLDPVDVEDVEEEEEAGEFGECGDDEELEATERFLDEQHHRSAEDSDDYESLGLGLGLGLEQQSPIKLIVRKGPEGQLNAQVFIGNEMLEKEDLGERAAVLDENTPASPKRGQADGTSEPGIESERISAVVAAGEPFPSSASASVPVPVCSPEVSKIDVASLLTDFANAIQ